MQELQTSQLLVLLGQLEHLITSSPTVPLGGRVMVRVDHALDLLARIRQAIPEAILQAQQVLEQRERVLQESQAAAERKVLQAEEYAGRLVQESEVLRQAQEQARRLLEEHRQKAAELEAGANEYADSVLMMVEQALERSLAEIERHLVQVRNGRQELARRLQAYGLLARPSSAASSEAD